jgi:diguanylate cyclase (GGDEF)-like protein
VLALVIYPLINQALVTAVIYLVARPKRVREAMLTWDEQGLELATLCIGILIAEALLKAPVLTPVSIVLVLVLRRSALVRTLQQQAMRDAKTGLLNAAAWRAQSEQVLKRAARDYSPVAMLVIDLDHFKRLNDSHGHLAGDNALRVVAGAITETLRSSDVVGRYGGEEFVALLPGVDLAGGPAAAERVCARIRELVLEQGGNVSASIGVSAAYRAEGLELDTMLGDADAAMYRAKSAGRDRVAVGQQFATTGVAVVAA